MAKVDLTERILFHWQFGLLMYRSGKSFVAMLFSQKLSSLVQ